MTADERARAVRVAVEEAKGRVAGGRRRGLQQHRGDHRGGGRRARGRRGRRARSSRPTTTSPPRPACCEHYRAIAKAHPGFPLVAYNVPGRTGVDLLPETVQRLCDLPEVVALKEATASMVRAVDLRREVRRRG